MKVGTLRKSRHPVAVPAWCRLSSALIMKCEQAAFFSFLAFWFLFWIPMSK